MFIRTVNDPDYYYQILNGDIALNEMLKAHNLFIYSEVERKAKYKKLIDFFIEFGTDDYDKEYFSYFIQSEVFGPIALLIREEVFNQVIYTFKYASVKNFFRDNWFRFIPEFDVQLIENNPQVKLLHNSFMSEVDYFSQIISEISIINDIDRVPSKYLDYIGQLLGYERDDNEKNYLGDEFFRIFLKNIVDIYNRKGTNFCIELFFNFIGYDIDIEEFFFDKRLYESTLTKNPFTNSTNRNEFLFYLVKSNPLQDYNIGNIKFPKIPESSFSHKCPNLILFNYKTIGNDQSNSNVEKLPVTTVLNEYTYFKTNFVNIKLKVFRPNLPTNEATFNSEDRKVIDNFIKFVAPVFIMKKFETVANEGSPEVAIVSVLDFNEGAADGWTNKEIAGFMEYWFDNLGKTSEFSTSGVVRLGDVEDLAFALSNNKWHINFSDINELELSMRTDILAGHYKDNIRDIISIYKE